MELQGLHHITMITGDARENVEFYADTLGLRLVKKTVNFDSPDAYHLYFGDEQGTPGTILTWFEFPGQRRGRAGAGMIHPIQLGVAGARCRGCSTRYGLGSRPRRRSPSGRSGWASRARASRTTTGRSTSWPSP